MKKVIIGSTNPVKIESVKLGFQSMFPDEEFHFEGTKTESGVRDQPMGDEETLTGAHNRAKASQISNTDADFRVGLEGGSDYHGDELVTFGWIVVYDKEGKIGKGKSGLFFQPSAITKLMEQGLELAHATDKIFDTTNSGYENGTVGILTDNVITRTDFYYQAVVFALIPFKKNDIYK